MNLSYLLKENYDKDFVGSVYKCPVVKYDDLRDNHINFDGPVRITYRKLNEYKLISKKLGLMDDFRVGIFGQKRLLRQIYLQDWKKH